MNGTSNAIVLENAEKYAENQIIRVNCTYKRNMFKQRLCGVVFLAAIIAGSAILGEIETLFFMVPVALYFIFTKKSILTFDYE